MMRSRLFRTLVLPLLGVTVALSGCASTKAKKDRPYVAQDVDTLYTAATATLRRHEYKLAAARFDEVERQHPYSVWARRAQLMSAYSYYVSGFMSCDVVAPSDGKAYDRDPRSVGKRAEAYQKDL